MITPLIVGNWKMNGLRPALEQIDALGALLGGRRPAHCDIAVSPPATILASMSAIAAPLGIATGAQDCSQHPAGAHTGDLSAAMIADAGAKFVILGHSERRAEHGETDALVRAKAEAGIGAHLVPIICVGESQAQRRSGEAVAVVEAQLAASVPDLAGVNETVIAYEPIWAIGTGLTPTVTDIAEMHAALRASLIERFGDAGARMRLLYGGSMKPANAAEILGIGDVNGGLIGGASLLSNDFYGIISAVQ